MVWVPPGQQLIGGPAPIQTFMFGVSICGPLFIPATLTVARDANVILPHFCNGLVSLDRATATGPVADGQLSDLISAKAVSRLDLNCLLGWSPDRY